MTTYNPGDVVLVPFPFTDFSTFKQRPAVILSSRKFNRATGDVIIAAITSHVEGRKNTHECRLSAQERHNAGLPKPSVIKLGKIVTLDQRLIRKQIGTLPHSALARLSGVLQKVFES